MEIGIDSFAKKTQTNEGGTIADNALAMKELIDRIVHADKVGLDVFGIGEHHREEFLDSAAHNILSAAAARTENIKLTSAVAVISAMDPVRLFQNYATLDLISNGRAEIVAGRGSFTEAYPLFGLDFKDYDDLYAEKLDLLLKIRDEEKVTWSGRFRPQMVDQAVYPRPLQEKLPVWVGVGGTPASFVRGEMYLDGTPGLEASIYAAATRAHDLKGSPPAYLCVGTEDLFYDEDVQYAARLSQAGIPCELAVFPGLYHGADSFMFGAKVSQRLHRSLINALRDALEG
jgi:alkanesulfonate monooxygenase SsuD/methylene tetrahydromethanopterin reductase-like flavin-dependent oxidoreductase (luciferase family)